MGTGKVFEMHVQNNLVGLIIGKGGESIKNINRTSGAIVFIPKEQIKPPPGQDEYLRLVRITGTHDQIENAKKQIMDIVQKGKNNSQLR